MSGLFAIKAGVRDVGAKTFAFRDQKTMYGGKFIAKGDTIFVFASERQTPRVSISVRRASTAQRRLGTQ